MLSSNLRGLSLIAGIIFMIASCTCCCYWMALPTVVFKQFFDAEQVHDRPSRINGPHYNTSVDVDERLDFDEFDQIEEDEDFTLRAMKHAGATHITARVDGGSKKGNSRKGSSREGISRSTSVA